MVMIHVEKYVAWQLTSLLSAAVSIVASSCFEGYPLSHFIGSQKLHHYGLILLLNFFHPNPDQFKFFWPRPMNACEILLILKFTLLGLGKLLPLSNGVKSEPTCLLAYFHSSIIHMIFNFIFSSIRLQSELCSAIHCKSLARCRIIMLKCLR